MFIRKFECTNECAIKKYINRDSDLNPKPNLNVFINILKMQKKWKREVIDAAPKR